MDVSNNPFLERELRALTLTFWSATTGILVAVLYFRQYATGAASYRVFDKVLDAHPELTLLANLVGFAALLMLAIVLLGGLPIIVAVLKTMRAAPHRGLAPLLTAVGATAIFFGTYTHLFRLPTGPNGALEVFSLLAVATALALAMTRCKLAGCSLRFALVLYLLATLMMGVIVGATMFWITGLSAADPQAFNGQQGIFGLGTAFTLLGIVAAMAGGTGIALLAALHSKMALSSEKRGGLGKEREQSN